MLLGRAHGLTSWLLQEAAATPLAVEPDANIVMGHRWASALKITLLPQSTTDHTQNCRQVVTPEEIIRHS